MSEHSASEPGSVVPSSPPEKPSIANSADEPQMNTADHVEAKSDAPAPEIPSSSDSVQTSSAVSDTPKSSPSLKLKLGVPPAETSHSSSQNFDAAARNRAFSHRRSDRQRIQQLKAEEMRRIREEKAAIEEARTKARSVAAKKAAATKKKAAKLLAEGKVTENMASDLATTKSKQGFVAIEPAPRPGQTKVSKKAPKCIVKLRYINPVGAPTFTPVNLEASNTSVNLFWLRTNLREFLYRFDKLCRLPARFTSGLNNPLESWTNEQFKAIIIALLKLIANDTKPLHSNVRGYIAEIEALEPSNPRIWDWLLEFVEQLDAFAPEGVPTTEEEQLELLRRLYVICASTETIRITVMSDVDQLKWVEKDAQEEIKAHWAKYKEAEQRLAKLKSTDKEAYNEKLAAAHRTATNKVYKTQQQLFMKMHKFNMRTVPVFTDPYGNRYWSLQYKSPTQAAWGSWILCEMFVRPTELTEWFRTLSKDVSSVLQKRDEMVSEKIRDKKKQRKEAKVAPAPKSEIGDPAAAMNVDSTEDNVKLEASAASAPSTAPAVDSKSTQDAAESRKNGHTKDDKQTKRRYPKLKINRPQRLDAPELYVVEGKDNIFQLAEWVSGFAGVDKKIVTELESIAEYLAPEV